MEKLVYGHFTHILHNENVFKNIFHNMRIIFILSLVYKMKIDLWLKKSHCFCLFMSFYFF